MEYYYKLLAKLIMKHPFTSVFTTASLTVPCALAVFFFKVKTVLDFGFFGTVGMSVIFSIIPLCLWLLATFLSLNLAYKPKIQDNTVTFNEKQNSIKHLFLVSSIVLTLFSLANLLFCYYFDLGFKWFLILLYLPPIIRILIFVGEYFHSKKIIQK